MRNPFSALLGGREAKSLDASNLGSFAALLGAQAKSGVTVSVETALRVSTVLACVRVLAEGIAQLPFKLMSEDKAGNKSIADKHPLHVRLWRRPNDWQTSFEWRESMMLHALLTKGGFSYINRGSDGRILEFLPILPGNITPIQDDQYGLTYLVTDKRGVIARLKRSDVLHVRGPSWDTVQGLEMVTQAREAIGLSIATDESLARLHSNGTRPSGILSTDAKLGPEAIARIKQSFQDGYAGVANAFKTILLDNGFKFTATSLSPQDSQSEVTRIRQVEEIARMFRVFPQMIGYADKTATYASAEQFFTAHVTHSLGPWIERWEQAVTRDALTEAEVISGLYPKFVVNGLLRGDAASRSAYYKAGINDGWLTRNEARRLEDHNPIEGLDEPLVPLNMVTVEQQQAQAEATAQAAADAGKKPADDGADDSANEKSALSRMEHALARLVGGEAKAGRAISATNENKLVNARDLVDEVLASVDQGAKE